MSKPKHFIEPVLDVIRQAQWGDGFDSELMDALSQLDQAEHFARMDLETLEIKGMNGSVKAAGGYWSREQALADLQAARDEFWRVKERIGAERAGENVFEIIAQHSVRLSEWMEFSKQGNPEIAIVAWLAEWLSQADGTVPTSGRVGNLIDALKGMGRHFDGKGSPETYLKAITKAVKIRVERQKTRASKRMEIIYQKPWKRHAKRWEAAFVKRWNGRYSKELGGIAKRIHDESLFVGKSIRVDKLMKGVPLPLKSGVDKSSPLFGR